VSPHSLIDSIDSSVASGRKVFVISNIGQRKILEGAAGSLLAGKLAAECVLLKLSGITVLMLSGREAPYTWKLLSRPIGFPRQ